MTQANSGTSTIFEYIGQLKTVNAELLEALQEAKGAVEFMASAIDSDPEDHELLELVNKAIATASPPETA